MPSGRSVERADGRERRDGLDDQVEAAFRSSPPKALGGIAVAAVRDYEALQTIHADGKKTPLSAPAGNMVVLDLASEGNYVAVRPSGTEPKVKFYFFSSLSPEASKPLAEASRSWCRGSPSGREIFRITSRE